MTGIDSALDYCCLREKDPHSLTYEEVCLRCGRLYAGTLEKIIDTRMSHICNPSKRKKPPKWALSGRKRDRSKS